MGHQQSSLCTEDVDNTAVAADGLTVANRSPGAMGVILGDLAVEVTFPVCGLVWQGNADMRSNEDTMRALVCGEAHLSEDKWDFTAGSQAEGVAMERDWGHGRADEDVMFLYGGDLAVGVAPPGQLLAGDTTLAFRPEGCPPAYTRLEVLQEDRLSLAIQRKSNNPDVSSSEVQLCVCRDSNDGTLWLHSRPLLDAMRHPVLDIVQGPAASGLAFFEVATGLLCTGPHPDMLAYTKRPRKHWPSLTVIQELLQLPMILVCVGPKGHPEAGSFFRVSWSPQEVRLLRDLSLWLKQGYVCFKYIVKSLLVSFRQQGDDDGRSRVGSYHLKTVFLRYLEENPPQPEGSPFQLVLDLCRDLRGFLERRQIPHYLLPSCNLLQTVGEGERQDALKAVDFVLCDPLAAIICSPSVPEETFGASHRSDTFWGRIKRILWRQQQSHDLLFSFHAVSRQPTCTARCKDLRHRLCDLDKHREDRHNEQLDYDQGDVSGRPELVGLADYWQRYTPG